MGKQRIVVPWMLYVILLAVLSVAERAATPEAAGIDWFLDATIAWFGLLGLVGAAVWSVAEGWRLFEAGQKAWVVSLLLLGGFFGPLFATIATTALAHDVDGAYWMIFSPIFGLLVVSLSMGIGTFVVAVKKSSHTE